jgi:hypothetical protein
MDKDRNNDIPFSDEVREAQLAADAYGVPFGAGLSISTKENMGYEVDSSLTVLPGDANKPDEGVKIKKK